MLLSCVHGGFLWLDRSFYIDTWLILWIIGLPSIGEDPLLLFTDKSKEKSLEEKMEDKYETHRGMHSFDIASINDDTVRFVIQVLACKFLRECDKDQVLVGIIEEAKKCITRVQMN
jgi:hypothetical protein